MKKVSVITITDNENFGSVLQAFALCSKIRELGYDVELIDYIRPAVRNFIRKVLSNKNQNLLFRVVYSLWCVYRICIIKKKMWNFLKREFSSTGNIGTLDDISRECMRTDIFVTGSDQVWNSYNNRGVDEAYYLNFTDKPKIAYAASIGMDSFPREEIPHIVTLLKKYKQISLRENESCDYLESLGLPRPTHCVDPTLLLSLEEWGSYVQKKKKPKENYLLVYSLNPYKNDLAFDYARKIAKRLNLKIYVITSTGYFRFKRYKCDKLFFSVGCDTFLQLFRDASFVVASSFHGTAFSINFSKEFISILPCRHIVRVRDIANKFGLAERVVSDDSWNIDDHEKINYKEVQSKLSQWRNESFLFLKNALADA